MNILDWIGPRTIYLVKAGSHAYGTNIATSDLDVRGICIPTKEYFLGFLDNFDITNNKELWKCYPEYFSEPLDLEVYGLLKYISLAADCNPNVIELLFADSSDYIMATRSFERILEVRDACLSKVAKHRFSGYAISQLKRIRGHYAWLKNPPTSPPTREEFGLPSDKRILNVGELGAVEALITKQIDEWALDQEFLNEATKIQLTSKMEEIIKILWKEFNTTRAIPERSIRDALWDAALSKLELTPDFVDYIYREKAYKSALNHYNSYLEWKKSRNVKRAELEAKFGYDTKHAMHLVRLLRMAREILTTGKVLVKRPDAQELLEIRDGKWEYEKLVEYAENEDKQLEELMLTSTLPKSPNRTLLNKVCIEIIEDSLKR